ncbi:MAG: radical SAM protein [Clostridiaceae bacterium]|nr:radical SAM protein [Clostridiaceae bacterium]
MKITLIKPNIGRREHSMYVDESRMEPLQLGVLAALTPRDIELVMYDDRMEQIPFDEPTDLVGITVETFTARRAYEISEEYRKRGVKVLMGGMHVKLIPEEVKEHCDSIMIGDAEDKWAEMIEDLRKGYLKEEYVCNPVLVPQDGIITRRDIFEGKAYLPITLLQFSRGCRFSCHYCASSVYFNKHHYCRNVDEVIKEIKDQKRKILFFVDDNIVGDKEKAKELFRALIPLKVKWVSQASIDMLEDKELMELMMKSGCLGHVIGFESIKIENITLMKKGVNKTYVENDYREAIKELRNWGLQTWAAFTVGHDNDTLTSIKETYKFALENKFTFAAYNILMPYPGTPLYNQLKEEGRLLYDEKWWLHPEYRFNYASFLPKNMTADELTEVSFWCRKNYNSMKSIIYRAFDLKTNMRSPYRFATYCVYNPVFKKEVFRKQGMEFGFKDVKK